MASVNPILPFHCCLQHFAHKNPIAEIRTKELGFYMTSMKPQIMDAIYPTYVMRELIYVTSEFSILGLFEKSQFKMDSIV